MSSVFEQSSLFPNDPNVLPPIVERIWEAKDRHFADRKAGKLTAERLQWLLKDDLYPTEPWSKSTVERARKRYPKLLPYWPMLRHHTRPWLQDRDGGGGRGDNDPVQLKRDDMPDGGVSLPMPGFEHFQVEAIDPSTGEKHVVELVADEHGIVRLLERLRHAPSVIAAGFTVATVLDLMSDGRLDNAIRWCKLIAGMMGKVTRI